MEGPQPARITPGSRRRASRCTRSRLGESVPDIDPREVKGGEDVRHPLPPVPGVLRPHPRRRSEPSSGERDLLSEVLQRLRERLARLEATGRQRARRRRERRRLARASRRIALGSHDPAKRDQTPLLATPANQHDNAETRAKSTPPHVHGKEGVDGSSPSEGLKNPLQISGFFMLLVADSCDARSHRVTRGRFTT